MSGADPTLTQTTNQVLIGKSPAELLSRSGLSSRPAPINTDLTQAERKAKGLCPKCGHEAAPYLLCHDCRIEVAATRMLKRVADAGGLQVIGSGKDAKYAAHDNLWEAVDSLRWNDSIWEMMEKDDKRLRPRLDGIPTDIQMTMLSLIAQAGKPVSVDEIVEAWGRLRSKRKSGSLTGDMTAIIEAQRKRDARNAKRAASLRQKEKAL